VPDEHFQFVSGPESLSATRETKERELEHTLNVN